MSSPPPHKRVLPHVDITEQGLRELELWLKGKTATATAGTALVVQDEGVALPVEPIMNFVGSAVTATDDPGGTRTTVTITGGSGIQFDTYPQTGDWLHVSTTGSREGVPGGSGIKLTAVHVIDIESEREINLLDTGGVGIYLRSEAGGAGSGFIGIQSDGETFIQGDLIVLRSSGHNIQFEIGAHAWAIFDSGQGAYFEIGSGEFFEVDLSLGGTFAIDSLPTSNPGGSGFVWNNGGVLNIT